MLCFEPVPLSGIPMIFVTVGTQLSFDRLIGAVDTWAERHHEVEVVAQIGPTSMKPRHLQFSQFVSPAEADALVRRADLIVGHAGMGTLLTALGHGKPVLIMPRKAAMGEHRNDHQLATARWLDGRSGVKVAWDESEIPMRLDERTSFAAGAPIPRFAGDDFVARLRDVVVEALKR